MLAIATLSVLAYGFNEAAGFTQRKRRVGAASQSAPTLCFNEAAGFTQRKHGAKAEARHRELSELQ